MPVALIPILIQYGIPAATALAGYIAGRLHAKQKAAQAELAAAVASVQKGDK